MNIKTLNKNIENLNIENSIKFVDNLNPEDLQQLKEEINGWSNRHLGLNYLKEAFEEYSKKTVSIDTLRNFASENIFIASIIDRTLIWGRAKFNYVERHMAHVFS